MRHLIIFLSLVLFASCSNDLQEVKEMPMSRSVGYEPTWWDSEERLPAPSEYWSGYRTSPYNPATVDTCVAYVSLVYSWGLNYDWYYYNRLQVQYREIQDGSENIEYIPETAWKWLGSGTDKYKNGIIAESSASHSVDIDAAYLPEGKIGLRYRLVHNDYPDRYDANYDNIMYTEWTMVRRGGMVIYNKGGGSALKKLFIHVSFPQTTASVTYSVYVDDIQLHFHTDYVYTYKRKKETGTYRVSALMQINEDVTEYKSAERTGTYDKDSEHIYVNFSMKDFGY